ncbi:MAG: ATP-binding cassette domain-containing protein [bacterium]|nr:ATP-binding cassette domain-containing protein [bacterium]
MFDLRHVWKRYETADALRDVNLSIPEGETTILIGPSGCGKSTLLRLLIGLIEPSEGEVIFEGERLQPGALIEMRRRMGYVIQDGGLFPHLTARENATLMAHYLGWSGDRVNDRLHELAELTHFPASGLDRHPAHLSGGQQQRVSLMRALMLDPRVLLMDEPLGALDPMIRAELQEELRDIFRTLKKTVVMVTHDLAEAAFFGHSIVLMRQGGVLQQGSLHELFHNPADEFVNRFIKAQRSHLDALKEDSP